MGLADDLNNLTPKNNRGICRVTALLGTLQGKELDAFISILGNDRIPHTDIQNVLANHGYDIPAATIGRHRRKVCRCER